MKRLWAGFGIAAVSLGGWAAPAAAAPQEGECPSDKWYLAPTPGGAVGVPSIDNNADGVSCWMEAGLGFAVRDNSVARP